MIIKAKILIFCRKQYYISLIFRSFSFNFHAFWPAFLNFERNTPMQSTMSGHAQGYMTRPQGKIPVPPWPGQRSDFGQNPGSA